ncbi:hypothetical protein [Aquicella siphonis]|uniref:hypothetical protein n=1 Tax=Aquicella siphonis TaxID=254247 RepID=UPI0011DD3701|nr:hypothetical protein [Aquicella siphonis]
MAGIFYILIQDAIGSAAGLSAELNDGMCDKAARVTADHHDRKPFRHVIRHEMRAFIFYTVFLSLLLFAFTLYRRILLNDFGSQNIRYGYSLIEALVLAKIILIGRKMKLGERYAHKPLLIPVLYKTVVFCLLMFLVHFTGYVITALFSGMSMPEIMNRLAVSKLNEMIAQILVMFFVFIFFFSFLEIGRIMGGEKLFNLFFKSRD